MTAIAVIMGGAAMEILLAALGKIVFGLIALLVAVVLPLMALAGGTPRFVGPSRAVAQAVAMSCQARLALLAAGPIFLVLGCMLISEPFRSRREAANERAIAVFETNLAAIVRLQAAGRTDEALAALAAAPVAVPCLTHGVRAAILSDRGEFAKAHQACAEAIKADPKFSYGYAVEAAVFRDERNYAAARESAAKAVSLPASAYDRDGPCDRYQSAGVQLGCLVQGQLLLFVDGNPDAARAVFDRGSMPGSNTALGRYCRMGRCFSHLVKKEYIHADGAVSFLFEKTPDEDGILHLARGLVQVARDSMDGAQPYLDFFLAKSNPPGAGLARLSWIFSTSVVPELLKPDLALDYGRKAVEATDRKDPFALEAVAAAYARMNRFEDAVKVQEAALAVADAPLRRERLELYRKRQAFTDREPWLSR